MCRGDEGCMLEVWRSCKEQPKCVEKLHRTHLADEQGKAASADQVWDAFGLRISVCLRV